MATNWITPTLENLAIVISEVVLQRANENVDPDSFAAAQAMAWTNPDYRAAFDPTLDDRMTEQLNLAVMQFRGAIQNAGKQPLSVTTGAVPPDACYKHCLVIAAYGVLSSTLNLQWVIATEKGDVSPLTAQFRLANKYLEEVSKGKNVVPPTDPTGRDYVNPINVPWGAGAFQPYNPNLPLNFPWYGPADCNPWPPYDPSKPINVQYQPNNYPLYDPTRPVNLPIDAVRYGANSRWADLTTYDGIFNQVAPPWFPAGSIGQP